MGDLKKILGYVGCAAVVVIMVVFAAVWTGFHRGDQSKFQQGKNSGQCSILFPASAGTDEQIAKVIDRWIDQNAPANSPLKGKGLIFAKAGRATDANINPSFIVAIARKESSFGTAGGGVSRYNPFGRMDTHHNLMTFRNWDEAIMDEGQYLKRVYVNATPSLTTVAGVLNKYAPPSENNTSTYVEQVTDWMNEMATAGNGVILGPACTEGPTIAIGKWAWPVNGKVVITSPFGVDRGSHNHSGLDIDTPNGPHQPDIKAVDNGTVSEIHLNENNMCGVYIYVDHGGGLKSLYCHLDKSGVKVSEGQAVRQGDIIALSDNSGTSTTGAHLHLGARLNGTFVNPQNYLSKL